MIKYLLPLLLLSCTLEEVTPIEITEPETIEITEEVIDVVYTLHGVYRRSIGSQYEVYDIGSQFVIYIQTGEDLREIYRQDFTYTEDEIIINGEAFSYELSPDKITICGYDYYRV
jgi:hypothetical protein